MTFTVASGPGSISGNTLTITGVGMIVVAADQAGNNTYSAATQVTQSILVNQAAQTISFTAPTSPVAYGVAAISLSATGGASGKPVIFSVISGPGTISGNTLTITGVGTVVVAADQAGNGNYAAATQVRQSISVSPAAQTISFTAPTSPVAYGSAPITLSATASSGLPVTFSLVSGPASLSGNTLTITGTGTVVIAANQAGSGSYAAAAQVTRNIVVNPADFDFKVNGTVVDSTAPPPAATVSPGGSATYTVEVTPTTGPTFSRPVTLALLGMPPGATCTITPSTIEAGSGTTIVTVVVNTSAVRTAAAASSHGGGIPLCAAVAIVLPFLARRKLFHALRAQMKGSALVMLLAAILMVMGMTACGGGSGFFAQTQETHSMTLTGTSGELFHSIVLNLTVQ